VTLRPNTLRKDNDIGFLPALAAGTLFVFYLVWAALHDIAQGESDSTLEFAVLIVSLPALAFLYRMALLHLTPKAKIAWLGGAGLVVLLFDLGAVRSALYPRYAADPMIGSFFLMAGVPVLGLIVYHFAREISRRRSYASRPPAVH
jgi:hypothetical protein